ncbi:MAG: ABC transporter substrate-binding protein [Reichenbachiella sp.]|uniref:ABC transporter substrate-binding protein n=1 Tax=Reichenbachiella sp. TaxID=2184521 RepID=UPI003264C111
MRKISFLFIIALALFGCETKKDTTNIAIVSIVEIDPIKQLRDGFMNTLKNSEHYDSTQIRFTEFNAQGEEVLISQIVDQIITARPELVYVLGTPISQAIQKRDSSIVIVQGAVTDPIAAGLADAWKGSGRNYAANSDLPPVNRQLALIRDMFPDAKKLGVLYNVGETNSVAIVNRLRNKTEEFSFNLIERSANNSAEIPSAVESLIGNVDALYIPPDNTIHSNMRVVGKVCNENKIPLFTTTSETVGFGATAVMGMDFYKLGEEAGTIAVKILFENVNPGEIPIAFSEKPQVLINKNALSQFSLDSSELRTKWNYDLVE